MPPNTSPADRAIYDAIARVEKSIAATSALRALVRAKLPIAAAESEMDNIDGDLDGITTKLTAALAPLMVAMDAIEEHEGVA